MDRLLQAVSPSEEVVEEVEDAVEVLRVEEHKGEVEAAVLTLEGPHGQEFNVHHPATLVRRQTEVNLMILSLFCYYSHENFTGESPSDDDGTDPDDIDDDSDGDDEDYHATGRNLPTVSWLHASNRVVSYMVTITATTWDVDAGLVQEAAYILARMPLITRWWVCYERGGPTNGGHVHILMTGHLSAEHEDDKKISLWWRHVLRLARKRVNGAKHTYKVHSKVSACPLLPCMLTQLYFQVSSGATQSFELMCAYLSKNLGNPSYKYNC